MSASFLSKPASWIARGVAPALPGGFLCALVAVSAVFVAERAGGPPLLYALVLGLALHFLTGDLRLAPGIAWCARTALRIGVALLGARITVDQVLALGPGTALGVMAAVGATILLGVGLAFLLRRPSAEGVLSGSAVGICGASAALAIAAVLPPSRDGERFTLLVVVGVALLSTVAMVLYPVLLGAAEVAPRTAGIVLGASIHDVAHVVAAGMMMGPETTDTATIVKLFRVALLAPIAMLVALAFRARAAGTGQRPPLVPGFLLGFLGLVALASLGWIAPATARHLGTASQWLLLLAIAACGMKTSFRDLRLLGWRPVVLLVVETAFIALAASAVALLVPR